MKIRSKYLWGVIIAFILLIVTLHYFKTRPTITEKVVNTQVEVSQKVKEIESKSNEIHQIHKEHDKQLMDKVTEVKRSIPDDITELVDLANTIIRNSKSYRR